MSQRNSDSGPDGSGEHAPTASPFVRTFSRGARMPWRGMAPGRRVWRTVVGVPAIAGLGVGAVVLATIGVSHLRFDDGAARPAAARQPSGEPAPQPPTAPSASPSPRTSPSPTPTKADRPTPKPDGPATPPEKTHAPPEDVKPKAEDALPRTSRVLLYNAHTKMCVDLPGSGPVTPGKGQLRQATCNATGADNQLWDITTAHRHMPPDSKDLVLFANVADGNRHCIDLPGGSPSPREPRSGWASATATWTTINCGGWSGSPTAPS